MKAYFTPDKYIRKFNDLKIEELERNGIKLLICDIDNTLVPHDVAHPSVEVYEFINHLKSSDLKFCFISNNSRERVELFAKTLHVPTYHFAKKPLKTTYLKIMRDYGLEPQQIACMGDQLMTDVLGGNRVGMYTILTSQLVDRDITSTKINRIMENQVFKVLEKKGKIKRGRFDE